MKQLLTPNNKRIVALLGLCGVVLLSLAIDARSAEIIGSWTSGLSHTKEAGSNRALIFTAHTESKIGRAHV